MLSMYRFMNRKNGGGELESIVRFQKIDFPNAGPGKATKAQQEGLVKALADAAHKEARLGQIVLATWAATGAIVAVEDLTKRGRPDSLVWLL